MPPFSGGFESLNKGSYFCRLIRFSYLEPPVEEMESNDKEAVDDGFESYEDSEDFEDAGQVFFCIFLQKLSWPTMRNGILLPKLFWPTVRKNCPSDREKLLKF